MTTSLSDSPSLLSRHRRGFGGRKAGQAVGMAARRLGALAAVEVAELGWGGGAPWPELVAKEQGGRGRRQLSWARYGYVVVELWRNPSVPR